MNEYLDVDVHFVCVENNGDDTLRHPTPDKDRYKIEAYLTLHQHDLIDQDNDYNNNTKAPGQLASGILGPLSEAEQRRFYHAASALKVVPLTENKRGNKAIWDEKPLFSIDRANVKIQAGYQGWPKRFVLSV